MHWRALLLGGPLAVVWFPCPPVRSSREGCHKSVPGQSLEFAVECVPRPLGAQEQSYANSNVWAICVDSHSIPAGLDCSYCGYHLWGTLPGFRTSLPDSG